MLTYASTECCETRTLLHYDLRPYKYESSFIDPFPQNTPSAQPISRKNGATLKQDRFCSDASRLGNQVYYAFVARTLGYLKQ